MLPVMISLMALSTFLKGVNAVSMKKAQSGIVQNFRQSIYFTLIFCALQALLLFFLPPYEPLSFSLSRLFYPVLFGVFYMMNCNFMMFALREGPTSLTMIINSFNSMFPIVVGLIFWGDRISVWQCAGLALFLFSLSLFNSGTYRTSGEAKPITLKWILLSLASMVSGGFAVLCTKKYMLLYNGYIKEYLIAYALTCVALCVPFVLFFALRRRSCVITHAPFYLHTAVTALTLDGSNIIFMLYISSIAAAFYFPLMSILSIVAVTLASRLALGEHISRRSLAGIAVSAAALALLAM